MPSVVTALEIRVSPERRQLAATVHRWSLSLQSVKPQLAHVANCSAMLRCRRGAVPYFALIFVSKPILRTCGLSGSFQSISPVI